MSRWRPLWDDLPHNVKANALSDRAFRLWIHILSAADPLGRLPASASEIKTRAIPGRTSFSVQHVDKLLDEIAGVGTRLDPTSSSRAGLIHLYVGSDGGRYLVLHDAPDWKAGSGTVPNSEYPPPPNGLCRCCDPSTRPKGGSSPSLSLVPSPERGLGKTEAPPATAAPPPQPDSIQKTAGIALAELWEKVSTAGPVPAEKAWKHFSAALHRGATVQELEGSIRKWPELKPWEIAKRLGYDSDTPKPKPVKTPTSAEMAARREEAEREVERANAALAADPVRKAQVEKTLSEARRKHGVTE